MGEAPETFRTPTVVTSRVGNRGSATTCFGAERHIKMNGRIGGELQAAGAGTIMPNLCSSLTRASAMEGQSMGSAVLGGGKTSSGWSSEPNSSAELRASRPRVSCQTPTSTLFADVTTIPIRAESSLRAVTLKA